MTLRLTILAMLLVAGAAVAQPIERSRAEVRAFRAENPCPSTARTRGACPNYQIDHARTHARALCVGGLDKASNMQWLSVEDHAWKTRVDVRECRKLKRMASTPARDLAP